VNTFEVAIELGLHTILVSTYVQDKRALLVILTLNLSKTSDISLFLAGLQSKQPLTLVLAGPEFEHQRAGSIEYKVASNKICAKLH
jgi:hypothetical protein